MLYLALAAECGGRATHSLANSAHTELTATQLQGAPGAAQPRRYISPRRITLRNGHFTPSLSSDLSRSFPSLRLGWCLIPISLRPQKPSEKRSRRFSHHICPRLHPRTLRLLPALRLASCSLIQSPRTPLTLPPTCIIISCLSAGLVPSVLDVFYFSHSSAATSMSPPSKRKKWVALTVLKAVPPILSCIRSNQTSVPSVSLKATLARAVQHCQTQGSFSVLVLLNPSATYIHFLGLL